jgi:microsomal dipeptidase-like Zn-dependent dipeptidase
VIADLHAHYPIHLPPGRSAPLLDRADASLLGLTGRFWSHRTSRSGPRVTIDGMREGGVGVVLSVLCAPLLELGERLTVRYRMRPPYGAAPGKRALPAVIRQARLVERTVRERHADVALVARGPGELERGLRDGRVVLVHCLEGGFHLGPTPAAVDRGVGELARLGVAYITLAHLVWRRVATNVPSLPFLPDSLYDRLMPQPPIGLTELGRTAVRAIVRDRVLIDIAHMTPRALDDTFELLDELDPARSVPLVASHAALRFGAVSYNLDDRTVERIAERDGVVGLMFAEHYAGDGIRATPTRSFDEGFAVLCRHIDRIHSITGSHRHTAIGSDFDGFFTKPMLAGMGGMGELARLEPALEDRYGADAAAIASGNALRLLRSYWRSTPAPPSPGIGTAATLAAAAGAGASEPP